LDTDYQANLKMSESEESLARVNVLCEDDSGDWWKELSMGDNIQSYIHKKWIEREWNIGFTQANIVLQKMSCWLLLS